MSARFALAAVFALALPASHAVAQAPAAYSPFTNGRVTPPTQPASSYQRVSGRSNPALDFYGGSKALAYAPQSRPLPLPAPVPVQTRPTAKPFSGVQQASAISPYLMLDARETPDGLPNYYFYVKPQMDQRRVNQAQQAQYRRLQQQVRTASAAGAATNPNGGIPTTGHSAQFMNNGGYYPGLR
jgi:hypothetical protein